MGKDVVSIGAVFGDLEFVFVYLFVLFSYWKKDDQIKYGGLVI